MKRKLECLFEIQFDKNVEDSIMIINGHTTFAFINDLRVPLEFMNRGGSVEKDGNVFTLVEKSDSFNLGKRRIWELSGLIPSSAKDEDVEGLIFELLKKSDDIPWIDLCAHGKNMDENIYAYKLTKFVITDMLNGDSIDFMEMYF